MFLSILLATLTFVSFVLTFWQWFVARRFPLHERVRSPDYFPPVTLLKPLKGSEAETAPAKRVAHLVELVLAELSAKAELVDTPFTASGTAQ